MTDRIPPPKAFGLVLQRYRREAGYSQDELSDRSTLDRTFISRLEQGRKQPTLTSILLLASALGVSPAHLVEETEKIMRLCNANQADD